MTLPHEGPQEAPIVPPPPGTIADLFQEALPDIEFTATQGAVDVILIVAREDVPGVLRTAKDDPRLDLKYLRCLLGVDHMDGGLEVVYQLYSFTHKHGVTIKTRLPLDDPRVASAASIWKGADWLERETAEMFGITFEGHPNPVPLLLPDDMTDHHPLRKDNPFAQMEEWQGLRLGAEASKAGHIPAGYESIAGEGGEEDGG
ncbi:MAG: NADH-quinone oxidoreductase subunit C [Dehalococcoidia bacterium]|nr:NADH-quinone oxidoreductase subunit C [Dehalococcoidia bacterium]